MGSARRLSDRDRTAACVMYVAAAFAFDRHRLRGWYTWCVDHALASADPLERSVWMAMRFEQLGVLHHDWLALLEQEIRHPTAVPVRRRDARWLLDALQLDEERRSVLGRPRQARWLREALRASELPVPAVGPDGEASP